MADAVEHAHKTAERVARESYGRLLAFLVVRTRDVAGAEDALADAFAAALRTWPVRGVPDNPDAWLLTAARHRQTDAARRRQTQEVSEEHLRIMAEEIEHASHTAEEIPDRRLALMFACAHPAIGPAEGAADPADHSGADRRRNRRGLSHPVRDHGSALGAREDTDTAGRHSVTRAGPRRSSRTP
jgi:hypothetical protein